MGQLENIYLKLPVSLQNLACSLEGWRVQRARYTTDFVRYLTEAEERAYCSEDEIWQYRDLQLRNFVRHAVATVPYYRHWFSANGIDPQDITGLKDLSMLPVVTKSEIQQRYTEFISESVPEHERLMAHTSGTTGGGLRFAVTEQAVQQQWAIWWRYRHWHGIQMHQWCGYFGGRSVVPLKQTGPPFWRNNNPGRQVMFSGYHMNYENLSSYVDELRRRQLLWLHGYPSLLALLADYLLSSGRDLGYQVKWITIGAESLLPQQAELIMRAFGVQPRQHYGMAEAVANISECERNGLHVDEDFSAVEFLPNPSDESYRIIGTNFTNPALPLLRYDVQDLVRLKADPCSCGRPGRLVASVDGRQEDYVILRNGVRVGRMDHIFKDLINIREAQIIQSKPGEMMICIVRGIHYTGQDEQRLLAEARQRVGADMVVTIEYVNQLKRSGTGKLRLVISEIPQGNLTAIGAGAAF